MGPLDTFNAFTPTDGKLLPIKTSDELLKDIYSVLPSNTDGRDNGDYDSTPYALESGNWYKTLPYGFRIWVPATSHTPAIDPSKLGAVAAFHSAGSSFSSSSSSNAQELFFFFPVNPESVSVNTPYAVQVTPTLGGIVEEHSGAVFYNITVSGTTGVLPSLDFSTGVPQSSDSLRTSASSDGLIPPGIAGGFGASTINAINSAVSKITGVGSRLVDGNVNDNTGYTSFHVLYKFIWLYHLAKANGSNGELMFVNYKDNNQYNVIIQNFQLSRDKSRPHLYQYTIQMKGWQLATNVTVPSFDAGNRLADLGLSESPSIKAEMFRVINLTKSTLNTAKNLLSTTAQDLAF